METILKFKLPKHNTLIFELPQHLLYEKRVYKYLLKQKNEALNLAKLCLIIQYILLLSSLSLILLTNNIVLQSLFSGFSTAFGATVLTNIFRGKQNNKQIREIIKNNSPWWKLKEFGGDV